VASATQIAKRLQRPHLVDLRKGKLAAPRWCAVARRGKAVRDEAVARSVCAAGLRTSPHDGERFHRLVPAKPTAPNSDALQTRPCSLIELDYARYY
jgi:hypothetical protein